MPGERPLLDGLRPVPGSLRLMGLRFLLIVLSAVPALLAALGALSSEPARQPYFTEIGGRLPLMPLANLFGSVFPAFGVAILVCAAIAVFADQFLTGGALRLLDPARRVDGRVRVAGTVRCHGPTHFWAFLRLLVVACVLSAAGIAAIRAVFKAVGRAGDHAGWTGATRTLTMPVLSACLVMLWLATVGAWFFWCRLLTVRDGRRRARRTALLPFRIFWRHPFRSWAFFVFATLATTLASGAVVAAWLQAEPKGAPALTGWVLAWMLTLCAQAYVWHWLLRAGCLLGASASLADLRLRTDEPFGIRSWIYCRFRKKPAAGDASDATGGTPDVRSEMGPDR